MSFRDAQRAAFGLGYMLSRDPDGEFRLAPHVKDARRAERQAYYSDDLDDVMGTLHELAARDRRAA